MENTIPTIDPIPTSSPVPDAPTIAPVPPMEEIPKKKSLLVPLLLGLSVLILGAIFGILLRQDLMQKPPTVTETVSVTPTITISPNQPLSAIASTSAFLQTESTIGSLSAAINGLNVSDTTLNPPVLDLPLGLDIK
jgi:hypothetical protein